MRPDEAWRLAHVAIGAKKDMTDRVVEPDRHDVATYAGYIYMADKIASAIENIGIMISDELAKGRSRKR